MLDYDNDDEKPNGEKSGNDEDDQGNGGIETFSLHDGTEAVFFDCYPARAQSRCSLDERPFESMLDEEFWNIRRRHSLTDLITTDSSDYVWHENVLDEDEVEIYELQDGRAVFFLRSYVDLRYDHSRVYYLPERPYARSRSHSRSWSSDSRDDDESETRSSRSSHNQGRRRHRIAKALAGIGAGIGAAAVIGSLTTRRKGSKPNYRGILTFVALGTILAALVSRARRRRAKQRYADSEHSLSLRSRSEDKSRRSRSPRSLSHQERPGCSRVSTSGSRDSPSSTGGRQAERSRPWRAMSGALQNTGLDNGAAEEARGRSRSRNDGGGRVRRQELRRRRAASDVDEASVSSITTGSPGHPRAHTLDRSLSNSTRSVRYVVSRISLRRESACGIISETDTF
jgi:hypothetical protein